MAVSRWPQTALLHDHADAAFPVGNILVQLRMMVGMPIDIKENYKQIYRDRFLYVYAGFLFENKEKI